MKPKTSKKQEPVVVSEKVAELEDDDDSSVYSGLEEEEDDDDEVSDDDGGTGDDSEEEETESSEEDEFKTVKELDGDVSNDTGENLDKKEKSAKHDAETVEKSEVGDQGESSQKAPDEYEYDSSDEEDIRNTVGNIPMNWYDEYPHIGYNLLGEKIMKPAEDNEIDDFLNKIDDPNYWRTVKDPMTGQKVVLTDEDVDLIRRVQFGKYPTDKDIYQPFEDIFSHEVMKHPVSNRPEHKRSFIPSLIEKQKVGRLVHAIKMGWIKPRPPRKTEEEQKFYMLWDKDPPTMAKRMQSHIPAPKMKLPGHEESYNPPSEYLFTKEEEEKWKSLEPEERKLNFIPQKYSCLRLVPSYADFIKERFERCLDLYLCPRKRKMRVNVDPNDLIPKLPKPRDLQPFPTVQALVYTGHTGIVRCICVEPLGQFLASGSDDKTVKIWEVLTGRCLHTFEVDGVVKSIAWCPNESVSLLLVAVNEYLYIINPNVGDKVVISNTDVFIRTLEGDPEQKVVKWIKPEEKQWWQGIRMIIKHPKEIHQVTWHAKGDYFASVSPDAGNKAVVIHYLVKASSQLPFQKLKNKVQCVSFHPLKPMFFVATQRFVRVYNLLKQELTKKLMTACQWVSSIAVHPQGDNVIVGSYDCRLCWFDTDLSNRPYKTLRYHKKAIRQVAFHKRYPLFASSSDDGSVIVSHGMVYSDLLQNPLIVPVKVLKGHKTVNGLSVIDCCFHPHRPWIFTSGADSTVRLYS